MSVAFNGVKVFSATMVADRAVLGEKVTEWLRANPHIEIVDKVITQSSDERFHCLAITLFYNEDVNRKEVANGNGSRSGSRAASSPHRG